MELYHATRAELVSTIKKEGLVPKRPFARLEKLKAVYLSKQPFKWMFNATLEQTPGALITVNVAGLKLLKDIHTDKRDMEIDKRGDFLCLEKIAPKRIVKIAIEKNKNSFEDI